MDKQELIKLLTSDFDNGKHNPLLYHPITDENIEDLAEHLLNNGFIANDINTFNDIDNPLEPLKIKSALQSEMMKLHFRRSENPASISPLDITIIACLRKCLEDMQ